MKLQSMCPEKNLEREFFEKFFSILEFFPTLRECFSAGFVKKAFYVSNELLSFFWKTFKGFEIDFNLEH